MHRISILPMACVAMIGAQAQLSLSVRGGAQLSLPGGTGLDVPGGVIIDGDATRIRCKGVLRIGNGSVMGLTAINGAGIISEEPSLQGGVEWRMEQFSPYIFPFVTSSGDAIPVRYEPRINGIGHRVRIATDGTSMLNTPLPSGITNTIGPTNDDLAADMVDRFWRITSTTEDAALVDLSYIVDELPQNNIAPLRVAPWGNGTWDYPLGHQLDLAPQETHMHYCDLAPAASRTFAMVRNAAFGMDTRLAFRALLGGPLDATTGIMNDALRQLPGFPVSEPFTGLNMFELPNVGGETLAPGVLLVTGNDAIVDWILVKLRFPNDPVVVVAERAALIQRDGDVVDMDGVSPVSFAIPGNGYSYSLHHRNHLGVMALGSFGVSTNATGVLLDLSDPAIPAYGIDARKPVNARAALWPGDVTGDAVVKYTGGANDRDPILIRIGGNLPTATAVGYWSEDVNMDGVVKYTGSGNDRDLVLQTIGGTIPTNVRTEQLP